MASSTAEGRAAPAPAPPAALGSPCPSSSSAPAAGVEHIAQPRQLLINGGVSKAYAHHCGEQPQAIKDVEAVSRPRCRITTQLVQLINHGCTRPRHKRRRNQCHCLNRESDE